ncbi:hypothetical protein GCM10017744_102550 [Streptomyces antimycoticus]|uniref:Helix-turn-helix domain containing protein n=1 Tax=Streptomyces antimycoticus TaxID=68175 RepID=A0A4D4KS62_9ACTN|nr:hypothetical protein [Streptomyces antimycoticus]GDY49288.1 hypothetical protein SANT12839_101700 [Streptomyces antimycoticus]
MTPPRRRRGTGGRRAQRNEAARLTDQLLDAGFNKKQVGEILGRNPSLVSQFFTKNKGASLVPALRAAVQAVQAGVRDAESLQAIAAGHIQPRLTSTGIIARVRSRGGIRAEKTVTEDGRRVKKWTSSMARAGRQHIASGASRLRPVVEEAAANGGKIAFTVRARKGSFKHDSGRLADSPGVRRNVVQRRDGTEERAYANNVGGPGSGMEGFDAVEFKAMVDAAGGDVAAAVQKWLVDNNRIEPGTVIVGLEIRAWTARED